MATNCTAESHAALKLADPLLVASGRYAGKQSDGDGGWLALHDCPAGCGSTLALDTRVILMWTAVREAGRLGVAGDLEGCCHELCRAAEHALSISRSLEWRAQEERARASRGVVMAVVP